MPTLGEGAFEAFRAGQQAGTGQNALGMFVSDLTDRMKKYQEMQQKEASEIRIAGAKSLIEAQADPFYQVKKDVAGSIGAISSSGQRVQPEADVLEKRIATGEFGQPTQDFQSMLATESPQAQVTDRARSFLGEFQKYGISGLSKEGISFQKPTLDLDEYLRKQYLQAATTEKARRDVRGESPERSAMGSSIDSALSSVNELDKLDTSFPGILEKAVRFGHLPTDPREVQIADLALQNLKNKVTLSAGGKQLTATEIQFINSVMPGWLSGKIRNKEALTLIKATLQNAKNRLDGMRYIDFTGKSSQEIKELLNYVSTDAQSSVTGVSGSGVTSSGIRYTIE